MPPRPASDPGGARTTSPAFEARLVRAAGHNGGMRSGPGSDAEPPETFDLDNPPSFDGPPATMPSIVNENVGVYYGDDYWNDLPQVEAWLNRKVSGDPDRYWGEHFKQTAGRAFKRALVLNCGNGNVEHGLLGHGVMEEAVGVDYSDELLAEARRAARDEGLPFRYQKLDINTAELPEEDFDLVVNHAAAHHIARIDRVFRELCRRLPADGVFVSHDYVGPHRNQYRWDEWDAAANLNRTLPERFRQKMYYPHLVTMLKLDPTEAIHSELILPIMRRYFTIDELTPLGGALAYQLLTHNQQIFAAGEDDPERAETVERILEADDEYTAGREDRTWFAYIVARPDKSSLDDTAQIDLWEREEEDREAAAVACGGEYYEHTTLQEIMLESERWQATAHRVQQYCDFVKARYDKMRSLPPYGQIRWAANTKLGQRIREQRRKRRGATPD